MLDGQLAGKVPKGLISARCRVIDFFDDFDETLFTPNGARVRKLCDSQSFEIADLVIVCDRIHTAVVDQDSTGWVDRASAK